MNVVTKLLFLILATTSVSVLLLMMIVDVRGLFQSKFYLEPQWSRESQDNVVISFLPLNPSVSEDTARSIIQLTGIEGDLKSFWHKEPNMSQDWKNSIHNKDQEEVVNKFCARHGMNDMAYEIPKGTWDSRRLFYKHILFDDNTKLIFAYLPKVASSHIRRFVCVLSRIFPIGTVFSKTVSVKKMDFCVHNSTFLNRDLLDFDRVERMKKYWKVAILRNPLERLVSGYRDKIVGENRKLQEKQWANEIKKKYNVSQLNFEIFLQWIIDKPNNFLNEHFTPLYILASPCIVRYNYYGNFKRLSEEMKLISGRLHVHKRLFSDFDYYEGKGNRTESLVASYFSSVSAEVKKSLFWDFYMEFDFYFSLFPEEKETINMLEVDN